jgi:hypothetical protein
VDPTGPMDLVHLSRGSLGPSRDCYPKFRPMRLLALIASSGLSIACDCNIEALPARRPTRQGTRRRQALVDVEDQDQVQAQILGEVEAIHPIELAMGRGKRVKISRK